MHLLQVYSTPRPESSHPRSYSSDRLQENRRRPDALSVGVLDNCEYVRSIRLLIATWLCATCEPLPESSSSPARPSPASSPNAESTHLAE